MAPDMLNPLIQALLILQERDSKRLGMEAQVKAVPGDITRVEQKVAAEKAAIEAARLEVRELETKKKLFETEIGSAETKLGLYRTQQLSIRKNEEYQAMGHQIATVQAEIADLEGKELEVMYAIDEAKKRLAALRQSFLSGSPCGGPGPGRALARAPQAAAYPWLSDEPPSHLFCLAPDGVFRAADVAVGAVGSYPTFSPLP